MRLLFEMPSMIMYGISTVENRIWKDRCLPVAHYSINFKAKVCE